VKKTFLLSTSLSFVIFSGCAVVDKTLAPVDSAVNDTKNIYHDTANYVDSSYQNVSNSVSNTKSDLYESTIVKFFLKDESILENREENFVKWFRDSRYNGTYIIRKYLKAEKSTVKEDDLELADKMEILKKHFFDILKKEYIVEFQKKTPKVKYDEFLTDRENIEKIYTYKLALKEYEHQWNLNLDKTRKKVASMILSTLFHKPKMNFVSYDPESEFIYVSIESKTGQFKENFKFKIDQDAARTMKTKLSSAKPAVYFSINSDNLEVVGASITFEKDIYNAERTKDTYIKQNTIVFSNDTIDLKEQDVQYTKIVQNITPPSWFYNLEEDNIGYGQGKNQKDAKIDAFGEIAQSKKAVVESSTQVNKKLSGSLLTKDINNKTNVQSEKVIIENSKTIKSEKKDGIWFVAVKY